MQQCNLQSTPYHDYYLKTNQYPETTWESSKAKDEGELEDIKVVLEWVYNTLTLCVRLTNPKFIAWTKTIQDILSKYETKTKNLETLIGRLNHTASIIPLDINFLVRIRFFHSNMNAYSLYQLRRNICDDLKLQMRIPQKARKDILMNLLTYREPTRIYLTDACEIGMGGLRSKGISWRWKIPK